MLYKDDVEYAAKRLNGTLVRTNNRLFEVVRTTLNDRAQVMHEGVFVDDGSAAWVSHEDIDLTPVPLGYINTTGGCHYLGRKPMRRDWRQGLSRNSLFVYGTLGRREIRWDWLEQPVYNRYPTFARVLESLKGKRSAMAFSREFAISKQIDGQLSLCYRTKPVGAVIDGTATLSPQYVFLSQQLSNAMGAK